jgi:hypothetical protein
MATDRRGPTGNGVRSVSGESPPGACRVTHDKWGRGAQTPGPVAPGYTTAVRGEGYCAPGLLDREDAEMGEVAQMQERA